MMLFDDEASSPADPHESDGEESSSLSLCDLPITGPDESDGRDRPLPPSDLFEFFFADLAVADMCSADDIFLRGKFLPYNPPPPPPLKRTQAHEYKRSETFNGFDRPRGCCNRGFTAEYRKLKNLSDPRISSPPSRSRPSWYLFVFGSMRIPTEMEMKDIRSRQRRRSPSPLGGKTDSVWCGCDGRGPWKLLRSLSCKGVDSAVVTAPLSFVSHVRGVNRGAFGSF